MKRVLMAGALALSMGFATQAMAKDVANIDLFVGDFAGISTLDMQKLAKNDMLKGLLDPYASSDQAGKVLAELKEVGIDYEKDFSAVAIAVNSSGHGCVAIDATKSMAEPWAKVVAKYNLTSSDYAGDVKIYDYKGNSIVMLSNSRMLACDKKIDVKPMLDNATSKSPKTLKQRDSALFNAYSKSAKSADIRLGAKMTKDLKAKYGTNSIDDGAGKAITVSDVDALAVSADFSKGLKLDVVAQTKDAEKAANGAAILTTNIGGILSDPSLKELGLDFLAKAVSFSSEKTNVKVNVTLSLEQITQIAELLKQLTASAPQK